jgi:hypothetical protein
MRECFHPFIKILKNLKINIRGMFHPYKHVNYIGIKITNEFINRYKHINF